MIHLTNIWQVLEAVLLLAGLIRSVVKWGDTEPLDHPWIGLLSGYLTYGLILGKGGFWDFPFGVPQLVVVGFMCHFLYLLFMAKKVTHNPYRQLILTAVTIVVLHYGRFW